MSTNLPSIFHDTTNWEKNLEIAKALSCSSLMPDKFAGKPFEMLVIMDKARSANMSPITVIANSELIGNKLRWSPEYLAARINLSRRYKTPLAYEYQDRPGGEFTRTTSNKTEKVTLHTNRACRAWAIDQDGARVDGPWYTCEMAVMQGAWLRNGSQWPWNTDVMLWHSAAAAFKRMHCPEILEEWAPPEEVEQAPAQAGGLFGGAPVAEYAQAPEAVAPQAAPDPVEDAEILAVAEEVIADKVTAGFAPIAAEAAPAPEPEPTQTAVEMPPEWMQQQYWIARKGLNVGQTLDKLSKSFQSGIAKRPAEYAAAVREWHEQHISQRDVGNV
jgi:hypothetical protein